VRLFRRQQPVLEHPYFACALVGLGLPEERDETRPWDVGYFVAAANHFFTAHFEDGRPSYLTVDG
jgi:hypothetical protein